MKPPKFHVGQAVIAIKMPWQWADDNKHRPPVVGKVYIVREVEPREGYMDPRHGDWFIGLEELTGTWPEIAFAPVELLPDEALAQLIEETLADPVTA